MIHSTKRLYFPDVVELDTQYDKYPIVNIPTYLQKESELFRQSYDEYFAQQRLEKPFFDAWNKFIALKRINYGL